MKIGFKCYSSRLFSALMVVAVLWRKKSWCSAFIQLYFLCALCGLSVPGGLGRRGGRGQTAGMGTLHQDRGVTERLHFVTVCGASPHPLPKILNSRKVSHKLFF